MILGTKHETDGYQQTLSHLCGRWVVPFKFFTISHWKIEEHDEAWKPDEENYDDDDDDDNDEAWKPDVEDSGVLKRSSFSRKIHWFQIAPPISQGFPLCRFVVGMFLVEPDCNTHSLPETKNSSHLKMLPYCQKEKNTWSSTHHVSGAILGFGVCNNLTNKSYPHLMGHLMESNSSEVPSRNFNSEFAPEKVTIQPRRKVSSFPVPPFFQGLLLLNFGRVTVTGAFGNVKDHQRLPTVDPASQSRAWYRSRNANLPSVYQQEQWDSPEVQIGFWQKQHHKTKITEDHLMNLKKKTTQEFKKKIDSWNVTTPKTNLVGGFNPFGK